VIDGRLEAEFRGLARPGLLILLKAPLDYLVQNISERQRDEEKGAGEIPEGLLRLVKALNGRYDEFVASVRANGWYRGPVLVIDVSQIDFVSNVRHLIAVYEGIEQLLVPKEFRG
jgi:deoxyadenosine/deoxycytidine kinase